MVFPLLAGMALVAAGAKGSKAIHDENRQARSDDLAYTREKRARERTQWAKDDALQANMEAAGVPREAQSAEAYQPTVDDEGEPMAPNPTAGTYKIDDQFTPAGQRKGTYASMADAAAAAGDANTTRSTIGRQAEVLRAAGKPFEAKKYTDAKQSIEKEGALDFIDANRAVLPSIDDIKAGKNEFQLTGVDRFNQTGANKMPDGLTGVAQVLKLPSGREVVDFRLKKPDGTFFGPSAIQIQNIYGMSREALRKQEDTDFTAGQTTARNEAADKRADRGLDIQQQNANTNEAYRDLMGTAATTRAENSGKSKVGAYERMDEYDKLAFTSLSTQINAAEGKILEAELGGTADPVAIGKARAAVASMRLRQSGILRKYAEDGGATPDPLGVRSTAPAPGGAPAGPAPTGGATSGPGPSDGNKVDPAVQKARDKDRLSILEAELSTARQQVASAGDERTRARAVGDVAALERELQMAQRTAKMNPTAAAEPATRAAPPAPVASMAQTVAAPAAAVAPPPPAPPPAPAAPVDPVEQAGAVLDAARQRAALALQAMQRYGSRQRASDPEGFAQAQAQANVAQAELAAATTRYRSLFPSMTAATGRAPRP